MRVPLCIVVGLGLVVPNPILMRNAWAAPPADATPTAPDAADAEATDSGPDEAASDAAPLSTDQSIAQAADAWTRGDWPAVRALLEPLADDPNALVVGHVRTRVLLLLADATLSDTTMPLAERRRLTASYLNRQMDADESWRLPPDIYTKALFDLYIDVSGERSRNEIDRCRADLIACRSDVRNEQQLLVAEKKAHDQLKIDYREQKVEVRDRVARSRIFAAIPFGVGHFYNEDKGLGAAFLSAELAIGISGLTLLLYRTIADGCRRRRAFQRGSLVCNSDDLDSIQQRRRAEETMAWLFVGTVALDILLAQIRFEPFETVEVRQVPRSNLKGDGEPSGGRRRRPKKKPKATVRPTAGGSRNGASLGVSIRF